MRFTRCTWVLIVCSVVLAGCSGISPRPPAVSAEPTASTAPAKKMPSITPKAARTYARALEAMNADRRADAEAILLRLTQEYPQLAGPYVNLGIIYYRSGRLQEAEQTLRQALALNPSRADAYNHLGIVLRNGGRFDEARAAYEKALRFDPDYAYAHLNLGILQDLYLLEGKKALSSYERYQQLQAREDQQVGKWIVELRRRVQRPEKTASSK